MASQSLKYAVFVLLAVLLLASLFIFITNLSFLIQNILWLGLLVLFIAVVWKHDFILMLRDYERAVIMRFGKVNRVGGPGWCVMMPFVEDPIIIDLRTQTIDVPKQDVITKGNIELKIDAIIYLRVKKDTGSIINSVMEVENYKEAIKLYIISSVRDVIGSMNLSEVIANTASLEIRLQKEAEKISKGWGINIVSIDIKDVDIPRIVLDAMHEEKAAIQKKLARMEGAQAHMAEIDAVRKAAENLSDKALSYYYVRALEKLGTGKSTKFIFPMELTKLAESIGGKVGAKSTPDLEELFEKYAPAVTGILSKGEKQEIIKKAKKKKK